MVRIASHVSSVLQVRERGSRAGRYGRPEHGSVLEGSTEPGFAAQEPEPGATIPGDTTASDAEAVPTDTTDRDADEVPTDTTVPDADAQPARVAVPDPFEDADALDELADKIATLAAHIHAATHRMLLLIADFDRRRGWELGGHRSCAHWLSFRTGIDLGAAREKVRAARALTDLPQTSAAMARGELSFSAVRALTRVATPENEDDLLEVATGCTTAQLERLVRAWKKGNRKDEAAWERERHLSRAFSIFPDDDGMYVAKGRLPAEAGALVRRALEAAGDALYRERKAPWRTESPAEAARRRADALALLAERALWAGFGGTASSGSSGAEDQEEEQGEEEWGSEEQGAEEQGAEEQRAEEQRAEDQVGVKSGTGTEDESPDPHPSPAEVTAVRRKLARVPISGTRAERYQVVLHVDVDTLSDEGEPGRSELEDGTRVSAETVRRLCCDGSVVPMIHDAEGSVLDVGRKTRTIPPALRRALEYRDRGCRFPGCGLRYNDGHHIKHWADGGETSLANCVLLCPHHHGLLHEGGWSMAWWGEGRPVFFDPRGFAHYDGRWEAPELSEEPAAQLVRRNLLDGIDPDALTAGARWKRQQDIPDDLYFRALESIA